MIFFVAFSSILLILFGCMLWSIVSYATRLQKWEAAMTPFGRSADPFFSRFWLCVCAFPFPVQQTPAAAFIAGWLLVLVLQLAVLVSRALCNIGTYIRARVVWMSLRSSDCHRRDAVIVAPISFSPVSARSRQPLHREEGTCWGVKRQGKRLVWDNVSENKVHFFKALLFPSRWFVVVHHIDINQPVSRPVTRNWTPWSSLLFLSSLRNCDILWTDLAMNMQWIVLVSSVKLTKGQKQLTCC